MADGHEIRADIDTETVKGLQLILGGSAAGLLAALPHVLETPRVSNLAPWMLAATAFFAVGLALSVVHNRLRRKCSLQYSLAEAKREPQIRARWRRFQSVPGEPRVCTHNVMFLWASLATFAIGTATVLSGAASLITHVPGAVASHALVETPAPPPAHDEKGAMFNKDTITLEIAIIGAVLGILNTWKVFSRDRPKLRVVPKQVIPLGGTDQRMTFCIEVVNLGGVALTINEVGVFYRGADKRGMLSPIIHDGGPWPRRLEPRTSVTVYGHGAHLAMPGHPIRCAYAMTDCGRTFEGTSDALSGFG